MLHHIDAWMAALIFAAAMLAGWGIGWWRGRQSVPEPAQAPGIKFTDASMALLGLLLAFTFAMTLGRHDQRRLTVVAESNAIGDFYTCASLLKEPHRSALQAVIRDYARHELDGLSQYQRAVQQRELAQQGAEMHGRMTDLAARAVADGTPIAICLTNTLNGVTSAAASRLASYEEILPWSIKLLLLLGAVVPSLLMGKHQGATREVCLPGTLSFIILVTFAVFVTLDLDQPVRGLITVNREPFDRLIQSFGN